VRNQPVTHGWSAKTSKAERLRFILKCNQASRQPIDLGSCYFGQLWQLMLLCQLRPERQRMLLHLSPSFSLSLSLREMKSNDAQTNLLINQLKLKKLKRQNTEVFSQND
jgi:hypothetical protein